MTERREGSAATTPTCQVTKESLACNWYFFSLLLECSYTYLATSAINELLYIVLWYWWICGSCDVSHLFPLVSISLSICWHLCATLHSHGHSHSFITVTISWLSASLFSSCTIFRIILSFFVACLSLTGAKDLQSLPQSVFLSFPTSLCRQQGPRRFCFKLFVRAGPTALSAVPHWH